MHDQPHPDIKSIYTHARTHLFFFRLFFLHGHGCLLVGLPLRRRRLLLPLPLLGRSGSGLSGCLSLGLGDSGGGGLLLLLGLLGLFGGLGSPCPCHDWTEEAEAVVW